MAFGDNTTRLHSNFQFAMGDAQYDLLDELRSTGRDFDQAHRILAEQEPLLWESMEEVGPEAKALVEGVKGIMNFLDTACQIVQAGADGTDLSGMVTNHADGAVTDVAEGFSGGKKG